VWLSGTPEKGRHQPRQETLKKADRREQENISSNQSSYNKKTKAMQNPKEGRGC
jgi:hypothetical protein